MLPITERSPLPCEISYDPSNVALIFDLDGTLVHSVPDLRAALNLTLTEDDRRPLSDTDVSQMVGNGVHKLVECGYLATGDALNATALEAVVERFMTHYNRAPAVLTRPYDGVKETLMALAQAGHPMAVCTNKPQAPAEDILTHLGLTRFFAATLGAGTLPTLKPAADPLVATLATLGHHGPAVMIGDSPNDTLAAKAAGLPSICVTFGYRRCSLEDLQADYLIDHFSALPNALNLLFSK